MFSSPALLELIWVQACCCLLSILTALTTVASLDPKKNVWRDTEDLHSQCYQVHSRRSFYCRQSRLLTFLLRLFDYALEISRNEMAFLFQTASHRILLLLLMLLFLLLACHYLPGHWHSLRKATALQAAYTANRQAHSNSSQ